MEIERGVEPLSGRLTEPHQGQRREFCGWTVLATTIDTAIDTYPGPSHPAHKERNE